MKDCDYLEIVKDNSVKHGAKRVLLMFSIFSMLLLAALPGFAQTLTIVAWNIESGKSTNTAVGNRIKEFQSVDVWGMSEVLNDTALRAVEIAAEDGENADFKRILGTTGGADRLGIVYNANRFTEIRRDELTDIGSGNQRAPLFAELKENSTGKRFIFMVNHLARGDNALRHEQGRKLNNWVRQQSLPVIAVGDFNFDWRVNGGDQNHDRGYDLMIADGFWAWVRPAILVRSQCAPNFDSVLDFVFVNQSARLWSGRTEILVKTGDCPANYTNDLENPDHRPVRAVFNMSDSPAPNRVDILRKIEELERQLQELKITIRSLPDN
jgi:endonuclease/exonuclease/phosphatase family metal-dependent hydrolase